MTGIVIVIEARVRRRRLFYDARAVIFLTFLICAEQRVGIESQTVNSSRIKRKKLHKMLSRAAILSGNVHSN